LEGRLAIVSGRSLEQLDALWGRSLWPVTVAASHGQELRHDGHRHAPPPANIFRSMVADIQQRFPPMSGIVVEVKT
ncbi:MAG: trehalose-phosphatase, partial [Erythrobacter sp.]